MLIFDKYNFTLLGFLVLGLNFIPSIRKHEAVRPVKRVFRKVDQFGILAVQVVERNRFKIFFIVFVKG